MMPQNISTDRSFMRLLWPFVIAFGLGLLLWPLYTATAVPQTPNNLDPSFDTDEPNPTSNSPFTVTLSFTDTVAGLLAEDFTWQNLAITPTVMPFNGVTDVFTLTLTPETEGQVTITLPANSVAPPNITATFTIEYRLNNTPFTTTINQKEDTPDPSNENALFTVVFGSPISISTFTMDDIDLATSTAPAAMVTGLTESDPLDGTTFEITVSTAGDGVVTATVPGDVVTDLVGNVNEASSSSDNSVMIDKTEPEVTINQKKGTPDPTNGDASFTVEFSEPINTSTFTMDDVDLSTSTAPAATVAELVEIDPQTFDINVTTEGSGIVTATIPSGVVQDMAGNDNQASTSSDNSVTIDRDGLGVTLALQAGQSDPTNQNPIFVITFTKAVSPTDFPLNLNASQALSPSVINLTDVENNQRFTAEVTAEGDGVIAATIEAGIVEDEAGNPNLASNVVSVVYDTTPPTITLTGSQSISLPLNTPYEELGATAVDNIDGDLTTDISIDHTALVTTARGTYPVTYTVSDRAGNVAEAVRSVEIVEPVRYVLYLPLIAKPLEGDIVLGAERVAGITIFTASVPLDFSGVAFSNTPDEMKIWVGDTTIPSEPQAYVPTTTFEIPDPKPGELHEIYVTFFTELGDSMVEIGTKSVTVFYLPNGDFEDDSLSTWQIMENDLPVSIQNGKLRMGDTHDVFNCNEVPFPASAQAAFQFELPAGVAYQLHVQGTVYTQDRLSDPASDLYDAFEVVLNNNVVQRFGNPEPELACKMYEVPVEFTQSIDGGTLVSLENHSRFDNWYNTYTEIEQIWIEQ